MLIRPATPDDAAAMAELINEVIAIGGTTAHQEPMDAATIRQYFIDGAGVETSVLAVEREGEREREELIGWQSLGLWQGEIHIGSFVRPGLQARGVGMAMFAATLEAARARGVRSMVASIRADNAPGLAFYAKAGFVDVSSEPDFALRDGTVVGRVHRRYDLA
jgi:L-amino acid N-acyltransferase YncA